ncbi:MAG: potassium transporter TrkG [Candidatus Electryoneaceae bacterium]|nr:potassium transporter TrkG [Candidatus Electryoneaceae bacterium]
MIDLRNVGFLVGVTLLFVAVMMLLPLCVSLCYGDGDTAAIGWSAVTTALIATILLLFRKKEADIGFRDGFAVVTFGWTAMALLGALPFYWSGAIPSFTDAFFESMSGFTTTGSSILGSQIPIESMPHGILFWRSLTHWIGGMGIILLSLAILPLLGIGGMQLFRAEVPGPTKDKLTPRIKDTAKILWMVYLLLSVVEMLLLWLGEMDLFEAACHTFGTMATCGFSTRDASIAAFNSRYIQYVIIFFMFMAGVNFSLHYRLMRGKTDQYWSSVEFRAYLSIIMIFTTAMIIIHLTGSVDRAPLEKVFRDSLFQVVSILTTTGYGSADWEAWGGFAQTLFVLLMFIGGMAGSTGGGTKVIRIQVMISTIRTELTRLIHPQAVLPVRIGSRIKKRVKIDDSVVRNILIFLMAFALILALSTVLLALMGLVLVTAFGAAIASLSNIGPGLGDVGATDNYSAMPVAVKWLLAFLMMLGRLEVFTVLVLFSRSFWRR